MERRESKPGVAELLAAAVPAAVVTTVGYLVVTWVRLLSAGPLEATGGLGAAPEWVHTAVTTLALLVAVLVVVADPTPRRVGAGGLLVYVVALPPVLSWVLDSRVGFAAVAAPLGPVIILVAVATSVWVAYHGGYERLVSAVGPVPGHPLLAGLADRRLVPGLSVARGLVAAGIGATIAAGSQVLIRGVEGLLRAAARSGTSGATRISVGGERYTGIPLAQFPVEWLFAGSLLLAVLLVTGPQFEPRDLLKGIVVLFGVQSTVLLWPALVPPFRPVPLLEAGGPVLAPMGDAFLLVGLAVAIWLAFHRGDGTVSSVPGSGPAPD